MENRYRIDENQIVHEVLDQEAMVVNLDNGHYYALEGTAVDIWQAMAAGASAPETAEILLGRYTGNRAEIEQAVRHFVAELVAESLLTPLEASAPIEAPAPTEASTSPDLAVPATPKPPFSLPVMYKYTDMANLIQMDPIREFDETGWPKRRKP